MSGPKGISPSNGEFHYGFNYGFGLKQSPMGDGVYVSSLPYILGFNCTYESNLNSVKKYWNGEIEEKYWDAEPGSRDYSKMRMAQDNLDGVFGYVSCDTALGRSYGLETGVKFPLTPTKMYKENYYNTKTYMNLPGAEFGYDYVTERGKITHVEYKIRWNENDKNMYEGGAIFLPGRTTLQRTETEYDYTAEYAGLVEKLKAAGVEHTDEFIRKNYEYNKKSFDLTGKLKVYQYDLEQLEMANPNDELIGVTGERIAKIEAEIEQLKQEYSDVDAIIANLNLTGKEALLFSNPDMIFETSKEDIANIDKDAKEKWKNWKKETEEDLDEPAYRSYARKNAVNEKLNSLHNGVTEIVNSNDLGVLYGDVGLEVRSSSYTNSMGNITLGKTYNDNSVDLKTGITYANKNIELSGGLRTGYFEYRQSTGAYFVPDLPNLNNTNFEVQLYLGMDIKIPMDKGYDRNYKNPKDNIMPGNELRVSAEFRSSEVTGNNLNIGMSWLF